MQFEGDKIRHMTKIWNDGVSLKQLGWGVTGAPNWLGRVINDVS